MKKPATLILILLASVSFSQITPFTTDYTLDSLLFSKINDFRVFYKVPSLGWDKIAYQMATHHTDYEVKTATVTHFEPTQVPNFVNLNDLSDRSNFYAKSSVSACSENVHGGKNLVVIDSNNDFTTFVSTIWHKDLKTYTPFEIVALRILYIWTTSADHKANLLSTACLKGAVSTQYKDLAFITKSVFNHNKPVVSFESYSTMNFIK